MDLGARRFAQIGGDHVRFLQDGLRQAVREFSGAGHRVVVGSPQDVADTIERWFLAGAADGFNLMPDVFPDGLEIFVDEVVPILRSRGLFRTHYAESTLRERFTGRLSPYGEVALARA